MRLYFPAMIDAIDLAREEKRLDHIEFAHTRSSLKVENRDARSGSAAADRRG